MDPHAALEGIANMLNAVTLIAKGNGIESGMTMSDRIQIAQMVSVIKDALPPQEESSFAGGNGNGAQKKKAKAVR